MDQQHTQTRQHKFYDKHTVLGTIVLMILAYIIVTIPAAAITGIICIILRVPNMTEGLTDYLCFGIIPMALLMLLFYKLWFSPEYRGILIRGFTRTLRLCPVVLVFWVVLCLPDFLNGIYPHTFTLRVFSIALTAGFSEEVIFRGLPLSYMKRQLRSEKNIPLIVIITGVVFGLIHITNIFSGATISASLLQGITASCIGIFFGALFMRGGNILVPILLHSLHDALLLSMQEADEVTGILTEEATLSDIYPAVICAVLAVYGFFLIRKSKRGEICRMWAETWSQTTENLPEIPAETAN